MIEALSSRCDMRDTAKYVVNSLNWRPRGLNTILHNTGIRTCHKKLQPQISHQIEYKTFCGLNILKYFVLSCLLGFSLSVTHINIIPVCMVATGLALRATFAELATRALTYTSNFGAFSPAGPEIRSQIRRYVWQLAWRYALHHSI